MKSLFSLLFFISISSLQAQTDSLQTDSTDAKNIRSNWNEELLKNRFSIGFDFSEGYSYREIKSRRYSEMMDCRNEHEHGMYLPKVSIVFHYKANNWIQFTTGISYFWTGFVNKENITPNDTAASQALIACNAYNSYIDMRGMMDTEFHDPRYVIRVIGLLPSQCQRQVQVTYNYIDIPLNIRISYTKRNFNFHFYGGMSMNYLLKETIHNTITSGNTVIVDDQYSWNGKGYRTKTNYSWLAGAEIRYSINKKMSVELHGGFQKQMINLFKQQYGNYYQEYHYRYEIGIGVFYVFNKK